MGVYIDYYLIYGWKLPYDMKDINGNLVRYDNELFTAMIDGEPNQLYSVFLDQMLGKYIVFGKVMLNMSIEDDSCFEDVDLPEMNKNMLIYKFNKLFGESQLNEEPKLFKFIHFS